MENKIVVRLVEKASSKIWHRLPDVTSFEHTCYINIGKELLKKEVTSIGAMATYYIHRASARHLKKSKYEPPNLFSDLAVTNEDGDSEYEAIDVLADVEGDFIFKENQKKVIDLLAQDDHLKRMILNAWKNGFTNASELSGILANTIGEKSREGYRKSIQRFKIDCLAELSA